MLYKSSFCFNAKMAKICISALLLQLLYTSIQGQYSPCPDRFTYIKKPGSDETIGEIEIRNPSINNLELSLKVDLKVDTQLPTSFIAGVNLTKSQEDAARDVLEGKPLLYHIYFPVQNPLPTVHRIQFNNDQICSGPEVSGIVVTIITLEHNFEIIIRPAQNQPNLPHQNTPVEQKPNNGGNPFVSQFTLRPPQQAPRPAPPASVDRIENYNNCGRAENIGTRGSKSFFWIGRFKTSFGEWPWVVAIFRVIQDYEYLCGGTLLTTRHVLTVGHCLKSFPYTNKTTPVNELSVALGRYKLMDFNESESVTMDVARYIIHPEYTYRLTADYDLAILILRSPVEFTAFIRPICLLTPSVDSHRLEQTDGIIVGWSDDTQGNRVIKVEEPRLAVIPISQLIDCKMSNPLIANLTSERNICLSGPNFTVSACSACGVSGSGLVVFDSVTGRYQLRGIVSHAVRNLNKRLFGDPKQYVVFVNVFKYLTWINQQKYST